MTEKKEPGFNGKVDPRWYENQNQQRKTDGTAPRQWNGDQVAPQKLVESSDNVHEKNPLGK